MFYTILKAENNFCWYNENEPEHNSADTPTRKQESDKFNYRRYQERLHEHREPTCKTTPSSSSE
jgi:hypothetical protein